MSALRIWVMAARPRTLPAALAPVFVGTAAAYHALQGGVEVGVTIDAASGPINAVICLSRIGRFKPSKAWKSP